MHNQALRWLFLDCNSYFASVEQALDPKLLGRPIAVAPLDTDATCAIAASYEAKAYGVKTGTPIWQAKKMCPDIIIVPAHHKEYVRYHHKIHALVEQCIPITETCSIDEFACQLMENEREPAVALKIAHNIKQALRDNFGTAIRVSIGLATNKFLAKQATDLQKPDGLVMLQPHDLPHALYQMNLRDLTGIGANMIIRLNRIGIYTVEDLYSMPPKFMRKIWGGVGGERYYYRLRGFDFEDPPGNTNTTIGHSRVLPPDLREPVKAHLVARRLMTKAGARLRRADSIANALAVSARMENGGHYANELRITKTDDSFLLLEEMSRVWQSFPFHRHDRVKKVSVLLWNLDDKHSFVADLLQPDCSPAFKRQKLCRSLDQLNQRYGRDTVSIGHNVEAVDKKTMNDFGTKIAFTRIPDLEEFSE